VLQDLRQDARAVLQRARSDEIKAQLRAQTEEARKLDIFGSPNSSPPTVSSFGATTGWKPR
jgi:2-hydroxychromene-2-carboxylate isomerase